MFLTTVINTVWIGLLRAVRGGREIYLSLINILPSSHYVILCILFGVGLELIFALQRWVVLVAISVVVMVIVGILLVVFEEKGRFYPNQIVLPVMATIGLSGFTFLLSTSPILHLYIVGAGLVLFFLLKYGVRKAYPVWNQALSLVVCFLNMSFVLGLRFHLYIPVLSVLVFTFVITALMGWQSFRRATPKPVVAVVPTLAMAFVLTEVVWVLQFLPSHYLVQAGIVGVLYYVIFNLVSISFRRKLYQADIIEYLGIGLIASLIILFSARWV